MNEEITPSQNKGLNFVLKLPDLNKDLITPLTNEIMMDIHRRTNLSRQFLGENEIYFKPPFLHVNLTFQNGNESTVQASYSILRPLFMFSAIMDKLTSPQIEKFLQQIHQWHVQHPTELLMPYDQVDIKIPLTKDCSNDHQELKKLFNTPLEILERYIKLYSTAPYYHIDTEVTEKDGITYFNIYIGNFLNAVGLDKISNKELIDATSQTIKLLAESQLPIVEHIMYDQAVAQALIDPEDPNPEETVKAIMKNYYGAKFMQEEKQPTTKSSEDDGVYRLKFDEKYPIPKPNVIIHNILPEILRTYLRRKCDQSNYLIHDLEINISETELQLSFEYAKKDGTQFNRLAPAFGDVMNSSWDPLSLKLFFEVLNKQIPLTANDFIFSIHQYFEGNPTQHEFPIKYLKFEVNSALQDDTEENILKANHDHYFEALNKVIRYLNHYCQSPFYRTVTSVRNKDDRSKIESKFEVSIYSFLNALDLEMIQQQEYVKSALLVPSLELEFNQ
nr:MAG TPA: hypothetical protein [Caudoviricetes sp.]